MTMYLPTQYEDFSLLNEQWNQARPAVAGLGTIYGQHQYRDLSYLNARLRPLLPAQVGMGGGSLGGNSLGADDSGFTKTEIQEMQDQMNGSLLNHGMNPIQADGALGPATCGALTWYQQNIADAAGTSPNEKGNTFEGVCAAVRQTPPSKKGSSPASSTSPSPAPSSPSSSSAYSEGGMFGSDGGTNWPLMGGAVAVFALGGALLYRASKKK